MILPFVFYSILDQQQKQSIPFQGGHVMGDYDGKVYVTSRSDIYALTPVAIEKQVRTFIYFYKISVSIFVFDKDKGQICSTLDGKCITPKWCSLSTAWPLQYT